MLDSTPLARLHPPQDDVHLLTEYSFDAVHSQQGRLAGKAATPYFRHTTDAPTIYAATIAYLKQPPLSLVLVCE